MAKTINVAPNVDGMLRWLRELYKTDSARAVMIVGAGWPDLTVGQIEGVLKGDSLADALEEAKSEHI